MGLFGIDITKHYDESVKSVSQSQPRSHTKKFDAEMTDDVVKDRTVTMSVPSVERDAVDTVDEHVTHDKDSEVQYG